MAGATSGDSSVPQEIREKIERAFDYRGNVHLDLVDGSVEHGYVFNRELRPREGFPAGYVEFFRVSDAARLKIGIERVRDVRLTGKDHYEPFKPGRADPTS